MGTLESHRGLARLQEAATISLPLRNVSCVGSFSSFSEGIVENWIFVGISCPILSNKQQKSLQNTLLQARLSMWASRVQPLRWKASILPVLGPVFVLTSTSPGTLQMAPQQPGDCPVVSVLHSSNLRTQLSDLVNLTTIFFLLL
jgi:hypothetical protein